MWYNDEKQKDSIVKAIRAGMSSATLRFQFGLDDEQFFEATKYFNKVKKERDQARSIGKIVKGNFTKEEELEELRRQLSRAEKVTSDELSAAIASFTLAIVNQSSTMTAEDPMEATMLMTIAEKASKVLQNVYGDNSAEVTNFEEFSKKLTY